MIIGEHDLPWSNLYAGGAAAQDLFSSLVDYNGCNRTKSVLGEESSPGLGWQLAAAVRVAQELHQGGIIQRQRRHSRASPIIAGIGLWIMDYKNFDFLKATLETKLATIATGYERRADIVIQQSPDALDQTQYAAERDLAVSLLNRETKLSRRVQSALMRMEDGTYGVCLICEEPISVKRLQAVPWAELCLGCQERSDRAAARVLGGDVDQAVELEVA